jgi:hypothetical protein
VKVRDIIYIGVMLLAMAATLLFVSKNQKKIAFVNALELYDGFEMKKELEQTFVKVQSGRKQQLDSLVEFPHI